MTCGDSRGIVVSGGESSRYRKFTYSSSGAKTAIDLEEWNRVTIGTAISAGAVLTYTVQVQLDSTGSWFDSAIVNSQADNITVLEGHVRRIRINITSYTSGSVDLEILQSG